MAAGEESPGDGDHSGSKDAVPPPLPPHPPSPPGVSLSVVKLNEGHEHRSRRG